MFPWVVLCISGASEVGIFCGLVHFPSSTLTLEGYHVVRRQWLNACTVVNIGDFRISG